MTTPNTAGLPGLIEKWRDIAAREKARRCWVTAAARRDCADELEAALARQEPDYYGDPDRGFFVAVSHEKLLGFDRGVYSLPLFAAPVAERPAVDLEQFLRFRAALELIAQQGPHYGPDGTRDSWRHWVEIAHEALDSQKESSNG